MKVVFLDAATLPQPLSFGRKSSWPRAWSNWSNNKPELP